VNGTEKLNRGGPTFRIDRSCRLILNAGSNVADDQLSTGSTCKRPDRWLIRRLGVHLGRFSAPTVRLRIGLKPSAGGIVPKRCSFCVVFALSCHLVRQGELRTGWVILHVIRQVVGRGQCLPSNCCLASCETNTACNCRRNCQYKSCSAL